ncbi:YceG-like family protein [Dethiosulfatibacter aminovorans DSM 17477]|uniref:YceG-like family protein n=1 Tax=Dethiosulfatibacter aminovorans DSM 17477 TaxID=1121476 RepID=A0A1M6CX02_9FIRM|nr:endolytic transglycosylase MltG [Dethiosulfatibacter aminovorans]SHI65381.1 YceG-like family protein [Dethiosulfatibacter aminovorans DSM 17477]
MKKLINAIKDFFYESTDYAIILMIVVVIGVILIWRFNILFSFDISKNPIQDGDEIPIETNIPDETQENTPGDQDPSDTDNEIPDDSTVDNNSPEDEIRTVMVTIPSGSSAQSIAEILYNKNLISDSDEFIQRSIELGMDTKLKSGDFEITSDMGLDEIIKEIARMN